MLRFSQHFKVKIYVKWTRTHARTHAPIDTRSHTHTHPSFITWADVSLRSPCFTRKRHLRIVLWFPAKMANCTVEVFADYWRTIPFMRRKWQDVCFCLLETIHAFSILTRQGNSLLRHASRAYTSTIFLDISHFLVKYVFLLYWKDKLVQVNPCSHAYLEQMHIMMRVCIRICCASFLDYFHALKMFVYM